MNIHTPTRQKWMQEASRMWKRGILAKDIADHFGLSRHAIQYAAQQNRDLFPHRSTNEAFQIKRIMGQRQEVDLPRSEYDDARWPHAKSLADESTCLGVCDCRWPLSNGKETRFCAAEVVAGKSWCAHHAERARGSRLTLEEGG